MHGYSKKFLINNSTHQCRFLAFALDLVKDNRVAADRHPLHISLL